MPRPRKGQEKTREDIRRIVRRVRVEGESVAAVAASEDLHRNMILRYLAEAERDPDAAYEEARAELEFRREMLEMYGSPED